MAKTVVGLYDDVEHARMAVQDLVDMGIPRSDISLMSRASAEPEGAVTDTDHPVEAPNEAGEGAAAGAGVGAALGGLGGLFVGLASLAVPGVGPILAAGPLLAALTGAALGAGVGAIVGALVGMGIPREEAEYYAEGIRRGGILVAVGTPEDRVSEVTNVLRRHNPVDIKKQAANWHAAGWKGYDPNAEPLTDGEVVRGPSMYAPVDQGVPADRQEAYTRDTYPRERGAAAREARHPSDVVVQERTYEEVRPWEDYQMDFQRDFERRWKGTSAKWADYETVYHYGYDAAYDPLYRGREWEDVEPDLRKGWEDRNDTAWDDIKDAVHAAWDRVRGY